MKFRKPSRDLRVDQNYSFVWECFRFVESLPDEFEIVPEGYVCVKWPKEYTRERMIQEADFAERTSASNEYRFASCAQALRALAAIAPERKKRMVELWIEKPNRGGLPIVRFAGETPHDNGLWCKVAGPIEIDY